MDSLFDELMCDAGLTAQGSFMDMDEYDQEAIMCFATLIVWQCSKIVLNADLEDVDGGDQAVLNAASAQILSKFGV